ncbi:sensor histidine kinase [Flavisphingomonas formosensis]|uniref:sensor histidine kinase n=1 Tax=Flavisphingomonas formosensis TaxID=861534 RepID=UPI0012F894E1|nr:sensor histidine kinase [Sphingomonas formosensis]
MRQSEAQIVATAVAYQIETAIDRNAVALRGIASEVAAAPHDHALCRRTPDRLRRVDDGPLRFAIFDRGGVLLCSTRGFKPQINPEGLREGRTEVDLVGFGDAVRFRVGGSDAGAIAIGEFSRNTIAHIAQPSGAIDGTYVLQLHQGNALMPITVAVGAQGPISRTFDISAPIADGQLSIELMVRSAPFTATEIVLVLLPILMWIAAALIGWIVVERLLLRPLALMQRAIADYKSGDPLLVLPVLTTPALEIRRLGDAFQRVTQTIARHEVELEQGLARQTKLTREVHHRVKNNLQIVASLINIHARGVETEEAAAAYASIQRRVDALAVVHRNHYAELEENRGLSLRGLISELASNLRATAPSSAASLAISLDVMPANASQDVAVPVAFLITEIVELVMMLDPGGTIAIELRPAPDPGRAILSVTSAGLRDHDGPHHPNQDRIGRVLEGLARQLRAPLVKDGVIGQYAIEIAIIPDASNPGS